jgi:hypothetical protein
MDLWSCMLRLVVESLDMHLTCSGGCQLYVHTYKVISGAQGFDFHMGKFECQSLDKILQSHNWECI